MSGFVRFLPGAFCLLVLGSAYADSAYRLVPGWPQLPAGRTLGAVAGGDQPKTPPDRSALVVLRADGSVAQRIGRWGNYDGQFMVAHDVAVGKGGAVYVGDIVGQRVQKFVRIDSGAK